MIIKNGIASSTEDTPRSGGVAGRSLVTGATGCIGLSLVRKLLDLNVPVTVLVRDSQKFHSFLGHNKDAFSINVVEGDISDERALARATVDVEVVYHTAAKVHSTPSTAAEEQEFFFTNVEATKLLLQACETSSRLKSFVFFSTIAVHGSGVKEQISENTICQPDTAYGRSKLEAERLVHDFFVKTGVGCTILRLAMVYGERDRGNFNRMICAIDQNRFVLIDGGRAKKSITYAETVADVAIRVAAQNGSSFDCFIVADPFPYSLRFISETIGGQLGKPFWSLSLPCWIMRLLAVPLQIIARFLRIPPPFKLTDVERLSTDTICDVTKLAAALNFSPNITLEEGIRRTVATYQSQKQITARKSI